MMLLPSEMSDSPRLRVLVAEDSLFHQKLAAGMLVRKGHDVGIAENGRQAVEISQRETFDLILMDVEMPEMDGLEATSLIRELEQATDRHVPIVAVTSTTDRERCFDAGMDGFLSKPLDDGELETVLRHVAAETLA